MGSRAAPYAQNLASGSPLDVEGPPLRLAFAGGGTGGHVVPGRHLLESLAAGRGSFELEDLVWFATGRSIEERAFRGVENETAGATFERVTLPLEPSGGGAPSLAALGLRTLPAVARARRALKAHGSDVLLGLGGFTTLPAVLAARSLGIPVCLLEINATRGKATRCLAPLATRIFHAWPATLPPDRTSGDEKNLWTGPPLGLAFEGGVPTREEQRNARERLGFEPRRPLLCVLGGSQGAGGINSFLASHRASIDAKGISVLHQCGPGRAGEVGETGPHYRIHEYIEDVACALRAADLVLCRGGASTLAEVCGLARPAVVVPYPHHADRHQEQNARQLGAGARVVHEEELSSSTLRELLRLLSPEGAGDRSRMSLELANRFPFEHPSERILAEIRILSRR